MCTASKSPFNIVIQLSVVFKRAGGRRSQANVRKEKCQGELKVRSESKCARCLSPDSGDSEGCWLPEDLVPRGCSVACVMILHRWWWVVPLPLPHSQLDKGPADGLGLGGTGVFLLRWDTGKDPAHGRGL